jgi:hypothetical protein
VNQAGEPVIMECPNCKLTNLPDALFCGCGYDFHLQRQTFRRPVVKATPEDEEAFWILVALSGLISVVNCFAGLYLYIALSPLVLVFVLVWVLIFGYTFLRFEKRALLLLFGASFGVGVPLLPHYLLHLCFF